jgi:CheY-like chemotaxis protein
MTATARLPVPARPLVLVADDEAAIQNLVARVITGLGLVALVVGDGAAAIAAVETHGDALVCVILDVVMPVVDGADAAQAIQHIAPDLAIVLMSGAIPNHYAERIAHLRLAGMLHKPFPLLDLRELIGHVVADSIALEANS